VRFFFCAVSRENVVTKAGVHLEETLLTNQRARARGATPQRKHVTNPQVLELADPVGDRHDAVHGRAEHHEVRQLGEGVGQAIQAVLVDVELLEPRREAKFVGQRVQAVLGQGHLRGGWPPASTTQQKEGGHQQEKANYLKIKNLFKNTIVKGQRDGGF
jgi:hypothetical protein